MPMAASPGMRPAWARRCAGRVRDARHLCRADRRPMAGPGHLAAILPDGALPRRSGADRAPHGRAMRYARSYRGGAINCGCWSAHADGSRPGGVAAWSPSCSSRCSARWPRRGPCCCLGGALALVLALGGAALLTGRALAPIARLTRVAAGSRRDRPLPRARAAAAAPTRFEQFAPTINTLIATVERTTGPAAPVPGRHLARAALAADRRAGEPQPAAPRPRSRRARALGR